MISLKRMFFNLDKNFVKKEGLKMVSKSYIISKKKNMKHYCKLLVILCVLSVLGACSNSTSNKGDNKKEIKNSEKFIAQDSKINSSEKEMNVKQRLDSLFNASAKDTIIASTSEDFQYQFAIESNSNEPNTTEKQIDENKEVIFENVDKQIGLKNYFTEVALTNIKESFETANSHKAFQYPLEFFFLAQYKASYWGEIKTNDKGYVNGNIDRNTIVFDGQNWKVDYVDSEGENVAKVEVTNDSIQLGTNGYSNSYLFDSEPLKSKVENKDNDPLVQSLQLKNHKYQNYSIVFENPSLNSLQLSSIGGRPSLVVTLNKEDSVWKINTVEYGY